MSKREVFLPPAVNDLIRQVSNPKEAYHTRENIAGRLQDIEVACRQALAAFEKDRSRLASTQVRRKAS